MSVEAESYVITPPPQAAIAVAGTEKKFPVRRIWCVGRNYEEHIREMGQDVRDPPFFFAKPADAIVPDGARAPYPPLTKDMHHEVELAGGDIIMTGTPSGVAATVPGDKLECEIEGVGRLTVTIAPPTA